MYELETVEGQEEAIFDMAVPLASGLLASRSQDGTPPEKVAERAFKVAVALMKMHLARTKGLDMEARFRDGTDIPSMVPDRTTG